MNIASGVPDLSLPSVFYAFDGTTIFVRFRLESNAVSYSGGANASNIDPWYSAQWTMMVDVNGDGWRDFAVFLDGASGSPSQPMDVIKLIYSNLTTTQSIDYSQSGIHLLHKMYAASKYTSGSYTGQIQQYDGNANLITSNVWANGRNTKVYDFGTSRGIISSLSSGQYFLEFQMPISAFDARAYGGPQILANTPLSVTFCTANSLNNPFQKDIAYQGSFTGSITSPMPLGDIITFGGGAAEYPVVTLVSAVGCPVSNLTTKILDATRVLADGVTVVSTITSVNYYYWYDMNGNVALDDAGSSWILIGSGTGGPVGTWKATWNTSSIPKGQYLIKVVATNQNGKTTDSFTQNLGGYSSTYGILNNSCGISFPTLSKEVDKSTVLTIGTTADRTVTYTISVLNSSTVAFTLGSISDQLPNTFSYVADSSGGTLLPTSSPAVGATGTISWTFSPPVNIPASSIGTLRFKVLAGTTPGQYANSVTATGSTHFISAYNVAPVIVTEASAVLQKASSTSAALAPGQSYSYTINYSNNGSSSLTNVSILDTLTPGLNFVSASGGGSYNSATRIVSWSVGSLSVGQNSSVNINVSVSSPYDGGSAVRNRAILISSEIPTGIISNTVTNAISSPILSIQKSSNLTVAVPGNFISYTLTYGNTGSYPASGVTIIDTLPNTLTYVTGTSLPSSIPITLGNTGGSPNRQILTWTIGNIAAASVNNQITFQALVQNPYPVAGTNQVLQNSCYLNSNESSPKSNTSSIFITANPSVKLTKTANSLTYGSTDTATFTLTLVNNGNTAALLSSMEDSLPSGFSYVSTGGGTLSPTSSPIAGATGTITWSFSPSVSISVGGTASLIFRARVSTINGVYTNTGKATGSLAGNGSSTISSSVVVSVSTGNEVIQKSVDKTSATVGDTLLFTIHYRNNSGSNQPSRGVWDTLASSLSYVAGSQTGVSSDASSVSFTQVGNVLRWAFGNPYRNNTSTTITFKAIIVSGGSVTNAAWSMNGTTPIQRSNVVQTFVQASPNITFTKSVNRTSAPVNSILTYTISYSNAGGAGNATGVFIKDTIPSNLTYVVGSASNGGAYSSSPAPKGIVTWFFENLPAGGSGSVSFSATIDGATAVNTVITNRAWLTNNESHTKTASVNDTVRGLPNFSFSKIADKSIAGMGDTLTYTLQYHNNGSASATGTAIADNIPANTTFISASHGGTLVGSTVSWTIGSVGIGVSGTRTLSVRLNSPIAKGSVTAVSNTASITCNEAPSSNSNTAVTTIDYPEISVNKISDNSTVTPGSTLTYTIIVSNSSSISSTGTILYDSIPSNTTYLINSTTLNGSPVADVGGMTPLVNGLFLGIITSSEPVSVTFKVVIASPLSNATKIFNSARCSNNRETDLSRSNTVITNVSSSPILNVAKSVVVSGAAVPGAVLTYTITYGNSGTATANGVSIEDAIPLNTYYIPGTVSGSGASYDPIDNKILIARNSISAGESGLVCSFQVRVVSPLPHGITTISNTATASANNAAAASASTTTNITASSVFNISKSAPTYSDLIGSPIPADTITFSIAYNFSGGAMNDSVYINDTLPAGLTYLSSTLNTVPSGIVNGQVVTWSLGNISPGTNGLATVTVRTTSVGIYHNSATIHSRQTPTGTKSNTTKTEVDASYTGTIDQTPSIFPGQPVSLTVTDLDLKGQSLIFVASKNTLTNEIEQVGLTETGSNTGIFDGSVSTTFGIVAGIDNDNTFHTQAGDSIRSVYYDAVNAGGVAAFASGQTFVEGGFTGTVSATPSLAAAGTAFLFTLTDEDLNYNNLSVESYLYDAINSTGEHELMTMTETGASSGVFVSNLFTLFGATPGPNNDGLMTVQPGNVITLTYFDTLNALGTNDTVSTYVSIGTVDFSSSQKAMTDLNSGSQTLADTVEYKILVKNSGNVTATSVAVVDTVPSFVSVVGSSISGGGVLTGNIIAFSLFNLPADDSLLLTFKITIDSNASDQTSIQNVARIAANGAVQLVSVSFVVTNRPVMSLIKTVSDYMPGVGDTIEYMINYTNEGQVPAKDVVVTDTIPNHTTYIPETVELNGISQTDASDGDEGFADGAIIRVTLSGYVTPGNGGNVKYKVKIK